VLFDYAAHAQVEDETSAIRDLVVVRSGQRVFSPIIVDYLKRISYGTDGYAQLIRLPGYEHAEVIADPKRSFGQAIFARGGVRVSDVLDRFWAGEAIEDLVDEFGVPVDAIIRG
jgi:uncharacterized protein (DUF433 family)